LNIQLALYCFGANFVVFFVVFKGMQKYKYKLLKKKKVIVAKENRMVKKI
jgi:hypothetical protein